MSAGDGFAGDLCKHAGVVKMEFIFEEAPFERCHASTIAESKKGLVSAWFGGPEEGDPCVGIWISRNEGRGWSPPVEVANGVQHNRKRYPCWNPVLYQAKNGPLLLFYKVGPSPPEWWGMVISSSDGGKSWSEPRRLPEDIVGPVKNKPVQLPDGKLLCPSSSENNGWRVHFERTADFGKSWQLIGPVNDGKEFSVIQPTILSYADGRLQALCRSRQGKIIESYSADGGRRWSKMTATVLPNPNSGIDAVTLADGRQLLVYNHTTTQPGKWGGPRSPLNVAVSNDGKAWRAALVLEDEPGEFSYPAVIQSSDGLVHISYTWKRRKIKHVVLDPSKLVLKDMADGRWPK